MISEILLSLQKIPANQCVNVTINLASYFSAFVPVSQFTLTMVITDPPGCPFEHSSRLRVAVLLFNGEESALGRGGEEEDG